MVMLEGGVTKNNYKNAVSNLFKNIYINSILPHQRTYLNQFFGKNNLSENDYTEEELNALRQAVVNHEWILNNVPDINDRINLIRQDVMQQEGKDDTPILKRYMERVIDYPDYKQVYVSDDYGRTTPVNFNRVNQEQYARLKNEKNPNFFMQGSVGQADYNIDNNGNVILKDKYDFTQDKLGDKTHYNIPAMIGKYFGTPFKTEINLGNINDWGINYSGNNQIIDRSNYLMNGY